MYEFGTGEVSKLAQKLVPAFVIGACALLIVGTIPAEAKKKPKPVEKLAETISDPANSEPLTLVVSLKDQEIDVYRGLTLIANSKVSTGTRAYPTKAGVFSILEKRRHHHSNMYSAAPMPWMQRLTWSGTALHAGVVPGYPASHGCIRLRFSFAPKLFQITTGGENVIVASDRQAPRLVEHRALFQPSEPDTNANSSASTAYEAATQFLSGGQANVTANMVPNLAPEPPVDQQVSPGGAINSATPDDLSSAPLRMLITRRTERDRIISAQYLLSSLGYLEPQKFSGRMGQATIAAIRAFQKANGMPETGFFTDSLSKKIYEVAGQEEPPQGHLFVRQDFKAIFDTPIAFRNPEQSLGLHMFTAMFAPGETDARWIAISVEGNDALATLDRLEIPGDTRERLSALLSPGSTLIIGDEGQDSAVLPDGGDFIVLTKSTSVVAEQPKPRIKQARVGRPDGYRSKRWQRSVGGYADRFGRPDRPGFFFRWRRQR